MHYYLGIKYPACSNDLPASQSALYQSEMEAALLSFDQALRPVVLRGVVQPPPSDTQKAIYYRTRGQLYYLLRNCADYDKATILTQGAESYQRAWALDPQPHYAHMAGRFYVALAETLREQNDAEGRLDALRLAEPLLWRAVQAAPANSEFVHWHWSAAGPLVESAAIWAEAVAAQLAQVNVPADELFEQAFTVFRNRSVWRTAGYPYITLLLQRMITVEPNNADGYWLLGWTYFLKKEYPNALEAALRYAELTPPDSVSGDRRCDIAYLPALIADAGGDGALAMAQSKRGLDLCEGDAQLTALNAILEKYGEGE